MHITTFPDIEYKDMVYLFNNLSKFIYYTLQLTDGELREDSYNMKLRSILRNFRHIRPIINALEPSEYKNLTDYCLCACLLENENISVYLVIDDNATYNEPKAYSISRLFKDSRRSIVVLADSRSFESNNDARDNILYMEEIIIKIMTYISDSPEPAIKIARLFNHIIFNYEDEWLCKKYSDMIDDILSIRRGNPIQFGADNVLLKYLEDLCVFN